MTKSNFVPFLIKKNISLFYDIYRIRITKNLTNTKWQIY